jgi:hypothetical protein
MVYTVQARVESFMIQDGRYYTTEYRLSVIYTLCLHCTCPSQIIYDSRHSYRLLLVVYCVCPSQIIHDSSKSGCLYVLAQIGEFFKKVERWPNLQDVYRKTSNTSPRLVLEQLRDTPGLYKRPGLYWRPGFY